MEALTDKNSWLEVNLKRAGQEAARERLDEAQVPEDLLAAFVQETRRTKAIPLPGWLLACVYSDLPITSFPFHPHYCSAPFTPVPSTPSPTTF